MLWYDWVMLGILAFTILRGAAKGFVWQLAGISALVLCFVFAKSGSTAIAPVLPLEAPLNRWVAMAILYVVLAFVCFFIAGRMKDWMERARLEEFDRHLGGIFGGIKGVVICLVATFFTVTLSQNLREDVLKSKSGYAAAVALRHLDPVMPEELANVLEPYFEPLHPESESDVANPDAPKTDPQKPPFEVPQPDGDPFLDPPKPNGGVIGDPFLSLFDPSAKSGDGANIWSTITNIAGDVSKPSPNNAGEAAINAITALHADDDPARARMKADIENRLRGIPDRVAQAALADWLADLTNAEKDPDPGTRFDTDLATRLRRQLQIANIPLDSLAEDVRERLR